MVLGECNIFRQSPTEFDRSYSIIRTITCERKGWPQRNSSVTFLQQQQPTHPSPPYPKLIQRHVLGSQSCKYCSYCSYKYITLIQGKQGTPSWGKTTGTTGLQIQTTTPFNLGGTKKKCQRVSICEAPQISHWSGRGYFLTDLAWELASTRNDRSTTTTRSLLQLVVRCWREHCWHGTICHVYWIPME